MSSLTDLLNQALALVQEGDLTQAANLSAQVLAAYPDDPNALAVSAFIAMRKGDPSRAVPAYRRAISAKPDIPDWHYHLARAYESLNYHAEATAAYRRAMELAPEVVAYRNNYAQSLLQEWHQAVGLPTVGREAHKTFAEKTRSGFFRKYLSGSAVLDIGFRSDFAGAVPIVSHAAGIDLDTPGYDGLHLPYADRSQDAIYSSHFLEHLSDPAAALKEWHRVVKPGGYIVIMVPHQHLYERKDTPPSIWNPGHRHFFTPAKLLQVVESALAPNTYRIRHLQDNDFLYDYRLKPTDPSSGCYEIELVLERIDVPAYRVVRQQSVSGRGEVSSATSRSLDADGVAAWDAGRIDAAIENFLHAARASPEWFQPHWHLGACEHRRRNYGAALESYQRAIALNPDHAVLRYHYAKALKDSGELDSAIPAYEAALALDPENPEIRYSQGLLFLLRGEWVVGWNGYELRMKGSDRAVNEHRPATNLPEWDGGEIVPGSGLIVYAEQGLGDSLMAFRYIGMLCKHFARVRLSVQKPLVRLFSYNAPPDVDVVARIAEPINESGFDRYVMMLSLPARFATRPDTVPGAPYLKFDSNAAEAWAGRFATDKRPRIGLVWQGGKLTDAPARDISIDALAPILQKSGCVWVSLQKGECSQPVNGMIDWTGEINDMADTAALIAKLDLVITVDTSVAHLAGAMGKPVWLLNRFESEWRWMFGKRDSPWYPTMRIFKQPSPGDWVSVVAEVEQALFKQFSI